jgi:uncharacterized membrane protein YeaQ/YmgE (transglycosylase-associated protein family)
MDRHGFPRGYRTAVLAGMMVRVNRGGSMEVHGLLVWILIGALAGWLSGKIVNGSGFGLLMDVAVGIAGAFLGGWLAGMAGMHISSGFISSIFTATLGAVLLLLALRLFKR